MNHSGFELPKMSVIQPLRRRNYYIVNNVSMAGDRPKDFIRVYEFGKRSDCRRDNSKTWIPYLAKVGDKWYPSESITEYLLNMIGEVIGMNMAKSRLYLIDNQIRFCSRYFLSDGEQLIHGVQIYEHYFRDKAFVKEVEIRKMERALFTFQEAERAIKSYFGEDSAPILQDFIKLLVFDAFIGNNDRHFYNWGVIVDLTGRKPPRFSPIFDTARGFFWNDSETKLQKVWLDKKRIETYLASYVKKSQPKTSWDGEPEVNHLKLAQLLRENYTDLTLSAQLLFEPKHLMQIEKLIDTQFSPLMSPLRLTLIKKCIALRFIELATIFKP